MSLPALAIDSVLPAFPMMIDSLKVSADNQIQFVISILFLGLILGQLLFGPISDSFGRKTGILIGLLIFIFGSILSLVAPNFEVMLLGRFLQGVGAAASRVICVAIARDLYGTDHVLYYGSVYFCARYCPNYWARRFTGVALAHIICALYVGRLYLYLLDEQALT